MHIYNKQPHTPLIISVPGGRGRSSLRDIGTHSILTHLMTQEDFEFIVFDCILTYVFKITV